MNKEVKKAPKMPVSASSSSPQSKEEWDNYWRDVKSISVQMSKDDRKTYDKRRNAYLTQQRQVTKLKALMLKYPNEVQYILHPETRPRPTATDMYPVGR
jgi:hypothetical protein